MLRKPAEQTLGRHGHRNKCDIRHDSEMRTMLAQRDRDAELKEQQLMAACMQTCGVNEL